MWSCRVWRPVGGVLAVQRPGRQAGMWLGSCYTAVLLAGCRSALRSVPRPLPQRSHPDDVAAALAAEAEGGEVAAEGGV